MLSHSLRENFLLESENFVLLGRFMVAAIQKHALWQVALEGEQRAEDTHAVRSAIHEVTVEEVMFARPGNAVEFKDRQKVRQLPV